VVGRSSYQVQKLIAGHRPDVVLQTKVQASAVQLEPTPATTRPAQVQQLYALAGYDRKRGELVIKAVNPTPQPVKAEVSLRGIGKLGPSAMVQTLSHADAAAENTLENPNVIAPIESKMPVGGETFSTSFAPNSLTVIRLPAALAAN